MKHAELKRPALQQPTAQAAYDALAAEFTLLRQMLQARADAGLTQEQVAARMGTKGPAIARLESSLSSGKHSPSLATLRRYAAAVGRSLEVRLIEAGEADQRTDRGGRAKAALSGHAQDRPRR